MVGSSNIRTASLLWHVYNRGAGEGEEGPCRMDLTVQQKLTTEDKTGWKEETAPW